jgi:hypothetical protein
MKKRLLFKVASIVGVVAMLFTLTACPPPQKDCPTDDTPMKQQVQKYLEHNQVEEVNHQFAPGYSAYFDFSDGMQFARDEQKTQYYKKVADLITGFHDRWDVYSLANEQIEPLEFSQNDLWNKIMNVDCSELKAPINNALKKIVDDDKLALLVTDFEEYETSEVMGKSLIEQAPYATEDFEAWLSRGGVIKFYIMDYVEKPKSLPALEKKLFFVVFDNKDMELSTMIDKQFKPTSASGLEEYNKNVKEYVLKSESFRVYTDYKGGNGGNYNGQYDPMVVQEFGFYGDYNTEFYAMGNRWDQVFEELYQAKSNDKACDGLLSKLYIDLSDEESRNINQLDLRVTDITDDLEAYSQHQFAMRFKPQVVVDENGDTVAGFSLESDTACFFDQEGHLLSEYEYDGSVAKTVIKDRPLLEINQDIFRESRVESPEKTRIVIDFAKVFYEAYGLDEELDDDAWLNEDMLEVIQSFSGRVLQVDVCVAMTDYDEDQSQVFNFQSHIWKKNTEGKLERVQNAVNDCIYQSIQNVMQHSSQLNNKGKVIYTYIITG